MSRPERAGVSRKVRRRRLVGAVAVIVTLVGLTAGAAGGAGLLPVLWTAGGLDPGATGAGQASRLTSDAVGNVAVVSGPARSLSRGHLVLADRIAPMAAHDQPVLRNVPGDWIVAAPNGDLVAVGHNVTSSGNPIAITMVRYASDGTLLWRVDLARTVPSVARLLVDAGGQRLSGVQLGRRRPGHPGAQVQPCRRLLWSQVISTGFFANDIATSLALSPDETDVVGDGRHRRAAPTWITAAYDTTTGARRWLVTAAEGIAARDVVVDATRVYVTGQGNVGITGYPHRGRL